MTSHPQTDDCLLATDSPPGGLSRWLRAGLLKRFASLRQCRLKLQDAFGSVELGDGGELEATIRILNSEAFYRLTASQGSVGAGEAYIRGYWRCDDLVALVRILVRNREVLDTMEGGLARLGGMLLRAYHALRRNTREGSRRNIAAHYDLGNAFFRLFLDDNLMYSSALFPRGDETLEEAQRLRLDRICQKLDLKPEDHLIEIGTGWGGFALHAASHYGCRVTTTTISREQHELAARRIQEAGLGERVTLLQDDYRDLKGRFDKLVSIEMIEAIGHQFLETYFATLSRLLKPEGLGLIQAITIEDQRYRLARDSVDFIKRFVFPGSFIPSVTAMVDAATRASDLRLLNLEDFGPSYALTLQHWRQRFLGRLDEVRALGYDEDFLRLWDFYLCYCEGGFLERQISDVHLLLARPGYRGASYLPGL